MAEDLLKRDRQPARPGAGDDLEAQDAVAAEREEIVVGADPLHRKHGLPDAASSASMPGAGARNGFALPPAAVLVGSGRAARSILPLASNGQTDTSCQTFGTM